ncbi:MAG: hypothetical protein ACRCW6_03105 [Mycoplasmoidaceae bacterium]
MRFITRLKYFTPKSKEYNYYVNGEYKKYIQRELIYFKQPKYDNFKDYLTRIGAFDIKKLIHSFADDSPIPNAQLYLILKYINAQIINNKNDNDKILITDGNDANFSWIDIFIDEGHILTTSQNRTPLRFLFKQFKMIGGYSGGIHFINQNIQGLLGNNDTKEFTTGMIDNAQYLTIFKLKPNDIKNLDELLINSNDKIQNSVISNPLVENNKTDINLKENQKKQEFYQNLKLETESRIKNIRLNTNKIKLLNDKFKKNLLKS